MTNFTINVQLDLEKDARNYRWAFNKNTHSSKRKEQVAETSIINLEQLNGIKEQDAYPFLREYLENFWEKHKDSTKEKIEKMQITLNQCKNNIFKKMIILTKHPIYRNDFTIYLTSLNRWPYNYTQWYSLTCVFWKNYITPFIHELLHFQTIHYYKEYIISKLHDEKKFEDLKEALTFLLNYEFKDLMDGYDMWYPQHQELRKKLEEYRVHSDKDFDKLVEYGCDIILNTANENTI